MTPEQQIRDAWNRSRGHGWPGMDSGALWRMRPRTLLTDYSPMKAWDEPTCGTFEPVEFRYERGLSQDRTPIYRVLGSYQGVTLTVARGAR